MNKISQHLIYLFLLLTISFGQIDINNQKSFAQKMHDNIHQALIMNQFSDGARPTEEIYESWSEANSQWESIRRYTYEYNLNKITNTPVSGLNRMTMWLWGPSGWYRLYYYLYVWNNDGTLNSWTSYDDGGAPANMAEYSAPWFNHYATSETISNYYGGDWFFSSWTQRTFDSNGFPIQTDHSYWNNSTNTWILESRITDTMDPSYAQWGCPQTSTYNLCTNGTCDSYYEYRLTYGQQPCATDPVPYNSWFFFPQCNPDRVDLYWFDYYYDTPILERYELFNYYFGYCLAETINGHNPDGSPFSRQKNRYWTLSGFVYKISTAYDNSDSRLTQVVTETYANGQYTNSQRASYAYEGIPLGTEDNASIPVKFKLNQNYPNPFNPITSISFELPEESIVSIKIYNSLGDEIKTLINEFRPIGQYQINWDGTNNTGEIVSGGTYFYQLKVGEFTQTRKMVLLK